MLIAHNRVSSPQFPKLIGQLGRSNLEAASCYPGTNSPYLALILRWAEPVYPAVHLDRPSALIPAAFRICRPIGVRPEISFLADLGVQWRQRRRAEHWLLMAREEDARKQY